MDFGRLPNIDTINFSMPADHPDNANILPGKRSDTPKIYVGCPIWTHKEWVGRIYPPKAKGKDFLQYYAQQYNSIELNATHYKIPTLSQIARWVGDVPDTFRFCPKVPQVISHARSLYDMKPVFDEFIDSILHFEHHLGCTFLQLPPYFKPDRLPDLISLLDMLPGGFQLSLELRHEIWFSHPQYLDALADYLKAYKFGLVITDVAGRRDVLHQRLTNTTAFIRFTANDLHPSDYKRMDAWSNQLAEWMGKGLERLYFFVHTPEKSLCPELAYYFIRELNQKASIELIPPKPLNVPPSKDLFS